MIQVGWNKTWISNQQYNSRLLTRSMPGERSTPGSTPITRERPKADMLLNDISRQVSKLLESTKYQTDSQAQNCKMNNGITMESEAETQYDLVFYLVRLSNIFQFCIVIVLS